jgi:hypothetical protein
MIFSVTASSMLILAWSYDVVLVGAGSCDAETSHHIHGGCKSVTFRVSFPGSIALSFDQQTSVKLYLQSMSLVI